MLEQLKYQNHLNEVYEFGKDGIFVDANTLHDYQWAVTTKGNKISALTPTITSRALPVVILCKTEKDGIAARNKLLEVVEKDVLAMKYGKIIIGDYYFRCYVTKSQKRDYLTSKCQMLITLTLTTDHPRWIKESKFSFRSGTGEHTKGQDLDFSFDFPFEYAFGADANELINTAFVGSDFKMVVYGACVNPTVTVSGHDYTVNCSVNVGEYLTIDSLSKKIFVTHNNGATTNVFCYRDRESYIFEKIPAGHNTISWVGEFSVDLTLYEERSEPKWI